MMQTLLDWYMENQNSQVLLAPDAEFVVPSVVMRRRRYLELYPELKELFDSESQARTLDTTHTMHYTAYVCAGDCGVVP